MSEIMIPTWIVPESEEQEMLDEGSSVFRAAFAPGLAQRQSYGGLRLKLSRRHTVRAEEKAQLLSVLKATRGSYNTLRSKVHFALRGSFPAVELLSNGTFNNSTTGWSGSPGETALSVQDRMLRSTKTTGGGATSFILALSANVTVTQYAPYVVRFYVIQGRGSYTSLTPWDQVSSAVMGANVSTYGLITGSLVVSGTTIRPALLDNTLTGQVAGDFVTVPYASLSMCALVDAGSNALLRSETYTNAAWTATRVSAADDVTTAPDGTVTVDTLVEDSSNSTHSIEQSVSVSSAAADYALSVALKAGTRTWAAVQLVENTGATELTQFINLSTGALGTGLTGVNWSNRRAYVSDLGDGWYSLSVIARKTNAATSLTVRICLASADNTGSYAGNGSSFIRLWRSTLAQSSVATRLVQTTTAASTGTAQRGSALHVKGLPASTSGLLLPEDVFEINGELKTCTAPLNSDAAGLGYLQFEPPLFRSPADSDPVIILDPMGKFLVSNIKTGNDFGTQARVAYDLEHIYE